MITLTVKERMYKKDSNWRQMEKDVDKALIASVDPEDDESVPVREDVPGEWFFTRDFTCRLYYVESNDPESDYDFTVMVDLRFMARHDSTELRYWFHDVLIGEFILETRFTDPDSDGDQYLEYVRVYKED